MSRAEEDFMVHLLEDIVLGISILWGQKKDGLPPHLNHQETKETRTGIFHSLHARSSFQNSTASEFSSSYFIRFCYS